MAVQIKRSEGHIPMECPCGCCTTVYGKHVKQVRRIVKHKDRAAARREINAVLASL